MSWKMSLPGGSYLPGNISLPDLKEADTLLTELFEDVKKGRVHWLLAQNLGLEQRLLIVYIRQKFSSQTPLTLGFAMCKSPVSRERQN
jgi:hypothetical protein